MNRRELLYGAASLSLAAATPNLIAQVAQPVNEREKAPLRLQTFNYRNVRLLPSRFADQASAARERYFNLSSDSILKGFRREAGLPAPGDDLKGWSKHNSGATFGQWVSGMARLSCATGDIDLQQKAVGLVEEWAKTIGPDGNCRMGTYALEKNMCGLVDASLYAGYPQAMVPLARITGWASGRFDRSRSPATPTDRDGRRPHGTLEWYTLTENSYRAYQASGNPLFRDFGALWLYPTYWDKFENSTAPAGAEFLHSYSHINTFCGAAMSYAVTGDSRYLKILRNAYSYATETQAYASGGYGPGEWSVPADGTLGRALETRSDSAEIPCGSWAGFKISKYLLTFTGEARYGDWIEKLFYNGIGAALPVQADGTAYYYADYRLDVATKLYFWDEWPCCSGTYIQDVADYHDLIYLHDSSDLYVNLLLASEVRWQRPGGSITVRQDTSFPEENTTRFTVTPERPVEFALKLRIPSWARSVTMRVNGTPFPASAQPNQWAEVRRTWNPGDVLAVELDMPIYAVPVDSQHPHRAAIKYGPVLLAQDAEFSYPLAFEGGSDDIASRFTQTGPGLVFKVDDRVQQFQPPGRFRPLYTVGERVPHRVYFNLDAPRFL